MLYSRGIRGAITVENNSADDLKIATVELISALIKANGIIAEDISHVIFTLTKDLDAAFPAKFAREEFLDWQNVPMMCYFELNVPNSLEKCLRVMIVVNTHKSQTEIKHLYLKGAAVLRKDLSV